MRQPAPSHPKLKRGLSLIPLEEGIALLRSADRSLVIRGEGATQLLPRLCPLLDGSRSVDEIATAFDDVAAGVIEEAISLLAERDLLDLTSDHHFSGEVARFFAAVNNNQLPTSDLDSAQLLIIGDWGNETHHIATLYKDMMSAMGIGHMVEAPADQGVPWAELLKGCDLVMFMPDRPALAAREALHVACVEARAKLSTAGFINSTELIVGPTVVPGATACWKCYEHRIQGVQPHYREYTVFQEFLRTHPDLDPVGSRFPILCQLLAGLAAFETVRILTNVMPPMTFGATMTLNTTVMALELHDVLKLPRCEVCGPTRREPPRRIWSW